MILAHVITIRGLTTCYFKDKMNLNKKQALVPMKPEFNTIKVNCFKNISVLFKESKTVDCR